MKIALGIKQIMKVGGGRKVWGPHVSQYSLCSNNFHFFCPRIFCPGNNFPGSTLFGVHCCPGILLYLEALASLVVVVSVTQSVCLSVCLSVTLWGYLVSMTSYGFQWLLYGLLWLPMDSYRVIHNDCPKSFGLILSLKSILRAMEGVKFSLMLGHFDIVWFLVHFSRIFLDVWYG